MYFYSSKLCCLRIPLLQRHFIFLYLPCYEIQRLYQHGNQHGFRNWCSCINCFLQWLSLLSKGRKKTPIRPSICWLWKSLDRMNWNKLCNAMMERDFWQQLISAVQSLNQGVKEGCQLSPTLFNLHIEKVIRRWPKELKDKFSVKNTECNTLIFADDKLI
jgi:hypothetical protein